MDDDAYFQLDIDRARRLVKIVRTALPLPAEAEKVRDAFAAVGARLVALTNYRALLDLRAVPVGRSDDAFDKVVTRSQQAMTKNFSRVAVLVRSAVGKLQIQRLGGRARDVFQDEAEAIRYLVAD